jgi:hypothetical protein
VIGGILLYVWLGAQACATCHAQEYAAWRASHYDLVMPRRCWMS